jgi:hypothetical protein
VRADLQRAPTTSRRGYRPRRGSYSGVCVEWPSSGSDLAHSHAALARSRACLQERGDRLVGDDDPALGSGCGHVVLGGRECLVQGRRAGRHGRDDGDEDVV